jgi:hypothetical protein
LHPYRFKKIFLFLPLILGGGLNFYPLLAQNTENKIDNLSQIPDASFLEYLGTSIEIDNESNVIELMEINELDELGLLTSMKEYNTERKDLKTMIEPPLELMEDKK